MSVAKQEEVATIEFTSDDAKPDSLSERLATVESAPLVPVAPEAGDSMRHSRSHFTSPAGRMVIGSRAAAPNLSPAELAAALGEHQLFSSARDGNRRGISSSTAALFVCALAVGTTAGLAALVDAPEEGEHAGRSEPATKPIAQAAAPAGAIHAREDSKRVVAAVTPVAVRTETIEPAAQAAPTTPVSLVIKSINGETGTPAPLDITTNYDGQGEYAFLMFRGIKDGFRLSSGFRLKESWAVSLRDLPGLQLIPPAGYKGEFELEVLLVKGRSTALEARRVAASFGIRAEPAPPPVVTAQAAPVPHILTSAPPTADLEAKPLQKKPTVSVLGDPLKPKRTISDENEKEMLDRAFNFLRDGDISSARLLLEHLARKGSGKGAMVLGQTYDPLFFRSMNTLGGMKPDRDKAMIWYQAAAELGLAGAQQRIEGLSAE